MAALLRGLRLLVPQPNSRVLCSMVLSAALTCLQTGRGFSSAEVCMAQGGGIAGDEDGCAGNDSQVRVREAHNEAGGGGGSFASSWSSTDRASSSSSSASGFIRDSVGRKTAGAGEFQSSTSGFSSESSHSSSSSSSSSSMKFSANGHEYDEEKRSETRADGTKIYTVYRSIDDQSLTVTRIIRPGQREEVHETLQNLTRDEIDDFERRWMEAAGSSGSFQHQEQHHHQSQHQQQHHHHMQQHQQLLQQHHQLLQQQQQQQHQQLLQQHQQQLQQHQQHQWW
eukprot:TRINITY_DN535_c1_g3_i1.p1 TRINITY_DN535_c1_g3~~TRINITY_DN535_c1_g3_i1.p1  ORF type:complete len:292 (-),score=84.12 TRINITY_DN535_c1_g3_i1:310-1155(-)